MDKLRPWGKARERSADAVAVDGGLAIGLFEGDKPCCYIVTDGRVMHKYAAVTGYYDVRPGEKCDGRTCTSRSRTYGAAP